MFRLLFIATFFLVSFSQAVFAQRDNSFKVLATMTGLGASYEWNPAGILYAEGGITTSFSAYRFNIQTKMSLYQTENYKLKLGVEGAYIIGNFNVGGIYIDYDRFNNLVFMPMLSFEGKVLGVQLPVFVDRSFSTIFPIVGITLNVSKDAPANRVKKEKSKKDFDKDIKKREKLREKLKELDEQIEQE
jgi:hypothetical protein